MISKRIRELADFIPPNNRIIDVGCDHALLDIYLAKKDCKREFIATDISKNAIQSAIKNIKKNKLESNIKVMVTDGLINVSIDKNDIIVICGMGTNTIMKIISSRLREINNIIVQTNRDIELLREFMFQNGFRIKDEKVVYDGFYYTFILFEKGIFEYENVDLWLGPIIKKSKNIFYFEYLLKKYKKILPGIPDNDLKKYKILDRINLLGTLIEKK